MKQIVTVKFDLLNRSSSYIESTKEYGALTKGACPETIMLMSVLSLLNKGGYTTGYEITAIVDELSYEMFSSLFKTACGDFSKKLLPGDLISVENYPVNEYVTLCIMKEGGLYAVRVNKKTSHMENINL